jgi:hypothetical protein
MGEFVREMDKRQIVIWAALTLALAALLFISGFQIAGRLQAQDYSVPYRALVLPMAVMAQVLWLGLGIYLAATRRRKPVLVGMLWGFGCETVAIFGLVLYVAFAHY